VIEKFKKFNIMGVVNITPNSFSDGGKLVDKHKVLSHVQNLKNNQVKILDFGAESTAPFNGPISEKEEWNRFEDLFFSCFEEMDLGECILSFDTYRPVVFEKAYHKVKSLLPKATILWNDVSGVQDQALLDTLVRCPEALYVFSHTNVGEREETSHHMKFVVDCDADQIIAEVEAYFLKGLSFFDKHRLTHRILLDPCFGFSKTHEQNMFLLKNFSFLGHGPLANYPWLVGISKKSFLRKSAIADIDFSDFNQAEFFHFSILKKWFSECNFSNLTIRLHDPNIYHLAQRSLELGF